MVKNSNFFRTFWPTLWKPLVQRGWLNARMCAGLCPTYATALGDAKENKNGRQLSCYRHKPQNWYYITQLLAHPVEPRDRWVQTHATVEKGRYKAFFLRCLYALIFNSF